MRSRDNAETATLSTDIPDTACSNLGSRVVVALATLCLLVVVGLSQPQGALGAPGEPERVTDVDRPQRVPEPRHPERVPGFGDLAAQLGLSPDDVADLIPAGVGEDAPQTDVLVPQPQLSPSTVAYLPLALHRSGPLQPPAAPTRRATPTPVATQVATPTPTDPADESDALFDATTVLDIQIEMDPADWDVLRVQARTMADIFGDDECMSEPHESPFTYFPADVWVNGDLIPEVGVRKKGFLGSISSTKPSLKISFNEYVGGQRYLGLNRLTLNNNKQDPSHMRQCLTYGLFAKAGLPAPRCSYARVTVNGKSMGVYTHIESIKKPFLERQFGDDSGNLYEGALSDFTPDWAKTFERKTNRSDPDRSDLEALVAAAAVDNAALLDALATELDIDEFLGFWAMEVLTGHWDGYANNRNNFYFYADPTSGTFTFIPWGTDGAFIDNARAPGDGGPALVSVTATAHLARRLYMHPEGRELYFTRLEALLDEAWHEDEILAEMNRTVALLQPELDEELVAEFRQNVAAVRYFILSRRPAIEAELQNGRPDRELPPPDRPCRQAIGHFHGSFAVRWEQPGVITATARVQLGDAELDLTQVGAAAAVAKDDPWPTHAAIQIAGVVEEDTPPFMRAGDVFVVLLFVDPERFGADRVLNVDGRNAFGWAALSVLQGDGSRQVALVGIPWVGELTLNEAGTAPGDPVSGTVDVDIVAWGGL